MGIRNVSSLVVFGLLFATAGSANGAGVWTALTNPLPTPGCTAKMLLTDGSVMILAPLSSNTASNNWIKLSPDASGNYINGTYSNLAPMGTGRLFFASNVLPSGKVFVMGGEYSTAQSFVNTGEIYDPIANTWSPVAQFPQSIFGDDPTILLPSGKVLCGYIASGLTYLYDPVANTWTQTGTKLRNDQSDEETWVLLPDGSVLSYDLFASPATGAGSAQRYHPSTGQWSDAGVVPIPLSGSKFGFEQGPATLLPDGRVFLVGANNNTAIYTPSTNSWVQGPSLPANMGSDDAPGAMLPNGHFLFAADTSSPNLFTGPTKLYDFDYTTNTLTDVTPPQLSSYLNQGAFLFNMLVTPNGHVLLSSETSSTIWDYAPAGSPLTSWAPTISGVPVRNPDGSYTLKGTQLTGISQGASFGDDSEADTNYPIVRLTSTTGAVTYARTTNWTPGVQTGSLVTSVNFTVPQALPLGTYQLSVIANGIPSTAVSFFNGGVPSNVTAAYANGTLTITGDNNPNSVTVSMFAGTITIQGANGTKINNTASFSTPVSGNWTLIANLNGGDDNIAFTSVVKLPNATISLGDGNDKAAFTLCTIGTLTINGDAGTNTFLNTSSNFQKLTKTNIR